MNDYFGPLNTEDRYSQLEKEKRALSDAELEEKGGNYEAGIDGRTIYSRLKLNFMKLLKVNEIVDPPIKLIVSTPAFKEFDNTRDYSDVSKQLLNDKDYPKTTTIVRKLKELQVPLIPIVKEMTEQKENVQVIYPKEIKTTDEKTEYITKTVAKEGDNATKKLIVNNLMSEKQFDDLLNQKEINEISDKTGLYNVLKNIMTRPCSCGYLCVEVGSIYGDFVESVTKIEKVPEKVTVETIIKPVLIVRKQKEKQPTLSVKQTVVGNCDELDITASKPLFAERNMRFKEVIDSMGDRQTVGKRRYYRRVSIGEVNLSTDVYKEGLNVTIVQRNRKYEKG